MSTSIRDAIRRSTQHGRPMIACQVRVRSLRAVSETFWRVAVEAEELAGYHDPWPADAFKIALPVDGAGAAGFPATGPDRLPLPSEDAQPVLRTYTVRRFDPEHHRIEFDVAAHQPGAAADWLARTRPGDQIGLAGMRREFSAAEGIDTHLLAGDDSALPAITVIVEALPAEVPATVLVHVEHDSDLDLLPRRTDPAITWITSTEPTRSLPEMLGQLRCPPGRVQAWIAAESAPVRELRHILLNDWQVARDDLRAAAYWKAGMDNTDLDAIAIAGYQRAVAEGVDPADPDVADRLEFGD